jgi:hypothetical protein
LAKKRDAGFAPGNQHAKSFFKTTTTGLGGRAVVLIFIGAGGSNQGE